MWLVDCLGESRVRENFMHGSGRGCWKRSTSNPRRRAEPPEGNLGIWQPGLQVERPPRQHPTSHCKDDDRRGSYEHERFDFLGYTFRPRRSKNRFGKYFVNFSPAVSNEAKTRLTREMRSWSVPRRSDKSLTDLALMFNRQIQGWINYYGRFYKSMLYPVFRHFNELLVMWATRKYKRLRRHERRARRLIADVARRQPGLFAHWRWGIRPDGWTMGAR